MIVEVSTATVILSSWSAQTAASMCLFWYIIKHNYAYTAVRALRLDFKRHNIMISRVLPQNMV